MQKLKNLLPVSNAIMVFCCAAQLSNFTRAAQQLGMSQASVSYFIKQLETYLGVSLFQRQHRKVTLTEAGEKFYQQVSTGMGFVERAVEELMHNPDDEHVTISSSTAFASYWLLPRMMAFRKAYPHIDLRLQTSDKDVNLIEESISLGIQLGEGNWLQYDSALLAHEQIYIIAKHNYFDDREPPKSAEDLTKHRLIHLDEPFRFRTTWVDWFNAMGVDYFDNDDGLRLNDYALVIQAALEGQGVAFGWHHIVDRLVTSGLLTKVIPDSLKTGKAFYLIWPKNKTLSPQALKVRDWIIEQVTH